MFENGRKSFLMFQNMFSPSVSILFAC